MKRISIALLALMLLFSCAFAESSTEPYENIQLLIMCPSLCTFDDAPPQEVICEAMRVYYQLHPDTRLTAEQIYNSIFACGQFFSAGKCMETELLDARYSVESAIIQPDGSTKVSIRVEADTGEGYEFWYLADIHLETESLRILRVFFPE